MRLFAFATALTLATACSSNATPAPATPAEATGAERLPDRDPALAKRLIQEEGGVLLDVRTPEEFEAGHIDGATNISHDQLDARIAEIETLTGGDKSTPIVTYCRSGGRAGKARATLEAAGYTQVTSVGGMSDYPTE